jgi:RNA polymerase sigma factor (sigma-70 family)
MKTADQLLRDYAELGSEAAFGELVGRYLDLVYSIAVRRIHGDVHLARDIAQTVFVDLARRVAARRGPEVNDDGHLAAWLHRHTCFVASNVRRSEQRRLTRERLANAMDTHDSETDSVWQQLAPVLDEAIQELSPADRDALLLRFYERLDLRAVGAALGVSDDTAQKRVSRAIERLRALLVGRSVTLSVGVLAGLLAERAIEAAPADWGSDVASAAHQLARSQPANVNPSTVGFLAWLGSIPLKVLIGAGAAALVTVATLVWFPFASPEPEAVAPGDSTVLASQGTAPSSGATSAAPATAESAIIAATPAARAASADTHRLHLTLLAADTGLPVPNVPLEYRGWREARFGGRTLTGDANGECLVDVDPGTTWLQLTTRVEGYADTRLEWRPDRGIPIPTNWTLRLEKAVPIGGTVMDADGNPVAGAKVGFNHEAHLSPRAGPESLEFSWIEVETDAVGRWAMRRIAGSMLRLLYGSASHPDHVGAAMVFVNRVPDAEARLRDGSWVFQLGRAVTVKGIVVDTDDRPIPGASVRVGRLGESGSREGATDRDGTFAIPGCRPGSNFVSATADGFGPATVEVEISPDAEPVRLQLERGRTLRIRVVDTSGSAVEGANVWLDTFNSNPIPPAPGQAAPPPPVQAKFSPLTDALGMAVWWNAPDQELRFDFHKRGHMRVSDVALRPSEEEHVVVLPPALVVSGTVTDATSNQSLPRFRMTVGWPDASGAPRWSTLDRFHVNFQGGTFRHAMEEAVVGGIANPGYLFKFEAEDYAPFVSRHVAHDEGEVTLDVRLEPSKAIQVTVLGPNHRPLPDADVGLVTEGVQMTLLPGRLDRRNLTPQVTDAQGQFRWSPDPAVIRVLVLHPVGFAMVLPADLAKDPTVRLLPWARIEGVVWRGGRPASNVEFTLAFPGLPRNAVAFDFNAYLSTSDAEGRFTFPVVPPVPLNLIERVDLEPAQNPGQPRNRSWTDRPRGKLELKPGETHRVELGKYDRTVRLGLRPPPGIQGAIRFAAITTPGPLPPQEIRQDPAALQRWAQQPEIRAALEKAIQVPLKPAGDGRWESAEIQPGQYRVQAVVLPPGVEPGPSMVPTVLTAPLLVPESAESGVLDLGELLLQPLE